MKNNNIHQKPSLIQTISAVLTAGVMWGSGNVIIRSLLLEGLNEIFLVTARVLIIASLLFSYYIIHIPLPAQLLVHLNKHPVLVLFLQIV